MELPPGSALPPGVALRFATSRQQLRAFAGLTREYYEWLGVRERERGRWAKRAVGEEERR